VVLLQGIERFLKRTRQRRHMAQLVRGKLEDVLIEGLAGDPPKNGPVVSQRKFRLS
jgi:hypothetical protein